MKKFLTHLSLLAVFLPTLLLAPLSVSAHEVYVLSPEEVSALEKEPPVSFIDIFNRNTSETVRWGLLVGFIIVSVFFISTSVTLENKFDKHLVKLKKYAPFIARVTIGLAFAMCGYHGALFGPEMPLEMIFGSYSYLATFLLYTIGGMLIVGLLPRVAGLIGLGLFATAVYQMGFYMVTYTNYLAEIIVLMLVGGHKFSVSNHGPVLTSITKYLNDLSTKYGELSFFILRVGFGISLIYASVYAKVLHNQLALAVVNDFDLVSVFGFTPEFIVFGAAIIEILLGLFIIFGIEIRFNSMVLNVFLTLSLLYFGEAVWPHIILMGIPIAFFCYGYDKYSLEGYFFKKGNREPIF
jgi:uncharacterized membrane protein YphA (DoxX/SURF4 family)